MTSSLLDHTWTFEWKTQPSGLFSREQSGWVLHGRSHTSPDTGWIVAHDVFHHLPGDTGTYAEEVTTFGAEAWLDQDMTLATLRRDLVTSWFSVMALTIENGTRGVEGLELRAPLDLALLEHPRAGFFRMIYQGALRETRAEFYAFGEPATWERLESDEQADRAVALAVHGYIMASQRWPDVTQARQQFLDLALLAEKAQHGDQLTVVVVNGQLTANRGPAGDTEPERPPAPRMRR